MISIDISADTPEEALAEGLRQLGVTRDAVETQVLSSAHDDTLPGAEPLPGVTLRLTVNDTFLVDAAREHLLRILEIIGVDARLETLHRRGGYVLNIHAGADDSLVIGKNGQNLEALQICVNRMVVHGGRDLLPIYVDCESYMEKRLSRLEQTAERSARRAQRDGVEVALEPMTPFERKIVHNVLKEMRGIHTLSRGEGQERHIVIIPDEGNIERQLRPRRGGPHGNHHGERPDPADKAKASGD
jgi:spoIIIJ-associated protein